MTRTLHVAPPATRKPRSTKAVATLEQIQLRAYEIFLERRGAPGSEVEDWLQAEREFAGTAKPRKSARAAKPKAA